MDVFKTKTGAAQVYPISEREYLNATGKKVPYCIDKGDGKEHLYAVCPICDNPIQIIALYRGTPESRQKPYGKHHKGDIPGLAKYDEDYYLACPLANRNWKKMPTKRRADDPRAAEVIGFLKAQYDRVIYALERDIGLHISIHVAEEMLRRCVANEVWTYRTARENNLPWVIAESDRGRPLFGQCVYIGSPLYTAIQSKCPEVALLPSPSMSNYAQIAKAGATFINLSYHFTQHVFEISEDGHHVEERITFRVIRGAAEDNDLILEQVIPIDTNRFIKLCQIPNDRAKRNQKLLDLAAEILP